MVSWFHGIRHIQQQTTNNNATTTRATLPRAMLLYFVQTRQNYGFGPTYLFGNPEQTLQLQFCASRISIYIYCYIHSSANMVAPYPPTTMRLVARLIKRPCFAKPLDPWKIVVSLVFFHPRGDFDHHKAIFHRKDQFPQPNKLVGCE
jgi:hypothetical protein